MDDGGSAGTFLTALQQLQRLHTKEIEELQAMLESQREQTQEKERQLKKVKENVSKAKKKIQQQSSYIRELESKLNIPHNASTPSTSQPTARQNFNKTAVSLFTESPTLTPSEQNIEQTVDPSVAEARECSPGIGIEDVGRLGHADPADESESTDISEEENDVIIIDKTNLHGDETVGPDETQPHSQESNRGLVVDAPQTCVSLFEHSVKTSPRRPLQLRRVRNKSGRIQYKETGNTSAESSSEDNLSTTRRSPSLLSETELPSPNLSESNSPPFLSSPHKPLSTSLATPSTHSEAMSVSIFQSTAKPHDKETLFKTPSTSRHNIPIPLSDSQFSLDVSQSFPPSPELCTTAPRPASSLKPKNLKRQLSDIPEEVVVLSPKQRKVEITPGPCVDSMVITKTPTLPPTTMIPITPGVQTVQTILSKASSLYPKPNQSKSSQHLNKYTDSEAVLPARSGEHYKRETSKHVEELETQGSSQGGDSADDCEDSPVLGYSTRSSGSTSSGGSGVEREKDDPKRRAQLMAQKAGLPEYPCVTKILGKADRAKLDGKECPECKKWYDGNDGIHDGKREHLRHTCRHKNLYLPPDTDPRLWDIGFPDSDECEELMHQEH